MRSELWVFVAVAGEEINLDTHAYVFKLATSLSKPTRDVAREYIRQLDAGVAAPQSTKSGSGKSGSAQSGSGAPVNTASLSKNLCILLVKVVEFPEDQALVRQAMKQVRTGAAMHAVPFQLWLFVLRFTLCCRIAQL